jgi:hypothetical protein
MSLIIFPYDIYINAKKLLNKYTNKWPSELFVEKSEFNFIDGSAFYIKSLFLEED